MAEYCSCFRWEIILRWEINDKICRISRKGVIMNTTPYNHKFNEHWLQNILKRNEYNQKLLQIQTKKTLSLVDWEDMEPSMPEDLNDILNEITIKK